jgi:hypothetical protein
MDSDEGEDMDIGELDLQSIVEACNCKEANSISTQQLQLLREALRKIKIKNVSSPTSKGSPSSLGIQTSKLKETKKPSKEEKKCERKNN